MAFFQDKRASSQDSKPPEQSGQIQRDAVKAFVIGQALRRRG